MQELFDNVYKKDYLGLIKKNSYDYDKTAKLADLSKPAIAKLSGVSVESVRFDGKIPREVKNRLEEIANILLLVADFFSGDVNKTTLWFKTPNPMLGEISPRDMIRLGRYEKLLKFVILARDSSTKIKKK